IFQSVERYLLRVAPSKWRTFLCKLVQRGCNGAEITDKPTVESCKSKKAPNLCDCRRCRPFPNGIDLAAVHLNALWSNNIAKKRDTLCAKDAFFYVAKQVSSTQRIKNSTQMF